MKKYYLIICSVLVLMGSALLWTPQALVSSTENTPRLGGRSKPKLENHAVDKQPMERVAINQQELLNIAKETTYYTEPLDQNGYVDYLGAINQELTKEVTPENNAAVLYLQEFPKKSMKDKYLETLSTKLGTTVKMERVFEPSIQNIVYKQAIAISKNDPAFNSQNWIKEQFAILDKPWKATDHPELKAFIDEYKPVLDALHAARGKGFWYPYIFKQDQLTYDEVMDEFLRHVFMVRAISGVILYKITLDLGEGDYLAAKNDLLDLTLFERNFARRGLNYELLSGYSSYKFRITRELEFANRCPDPNLLKEYLLELRALPKLRTLSETVDNYDRIAGLTFLKLLAMRKQGLVNDQVVKNSFVLSDAAASMLFNHHYDLNEVSTQVNNRYNELSRILSLPWAEKKGQLKLMDDQILQTKEKIRYPNRIMDNMLSQQAYRSKVITSIIEALTFPAISKFKASEDIYNMRCQLSELAVLLNLFRLEQNQYPQSLEQLVPIYIEKVPLDIFTGSQLKYTSDGKTYLLYSVGENEQDDLGLTYDEGRDDLTVKFKSE